MAYNRTTKVSTFFLQPLQERSGIVVLDGAIRLLERIKSKFKTDVRLIVLSSLTISTVPIDG